MINDFKKEGFLLKKNFLDKGEIEKIRTDAKNVFLRQLLHKGYIKDINVPESEFETALYKFFQEDLECYINCGKMCQHLISLHRLSLDERIISEIQRLNITTPNISTRPVMYFNSRFLAASESYYKSPVHQDWRSMQGSLNSIVAWIPLVDIDKKLGTLEIIPKSHLWGLVESEQDDWFRRIDGIDSNNFVSVDVEAGDVLFFSAFLIHQSGDNVTQSIRWSCHFRYNDLSESTFIERGYPHPYIYKPQQELITPNFPPLDLLIKAFS
jgi:phytanoyl-CoA hydroxylase